MESLFPVWYKEIYMIQKGNQFIFYERKETDE